MCWIERAFVRRASVDAVSVSTGPRLHATPCCPGGAVGSGPWVRGAVEPNPGDSSIGNRECRNHNSLGSNFGVEGEGLRIAIALLRWG